jgi:hypothetical protein
MTNEDRMYRGLYSRRRCGIRDLEVDDFVGEPFLEPRDTFSQVASRLIFRICNREDGDFRKRMLEDRLEVRWEGAWTSFLATCLCTTDLRHTECIVPAL